MSEINKMVDKKAIDVTPLNHGIYCRVDGSEPFVNPIVSRDWSDDGTKIFFMLDSHNFYSCEPDKEMKVVEIEPLYHKELYEKCLLDDAEKMAKRPQPEPSDKDYIRALESQLQAKDAEIAKKAQLVAGLEQVITEENGIHQRQIDKMKEQLATAKRLLRLREHCHCCDHCLCGHHKYFDEPKHAPDCELDALLKEGE